jgi:EB1-like C-terminal motif
VSLNRKMKQLEQALETVESDRSYYFERLRAIEQLCQRAEQEASATLSRETLQSLLYAE